MKNNKKMGMITLAIALVAVIALGTIAYASFTQQLDINGTATVKKASWSIKFANLQPAVKTGTAEEVTAPAIDTNDTRIGDYKVNLTTPGDSISYTFDVTNDGTFDAKISSITIPTPVCTGTGDSKTTDETNVCGNVTYSLTYDNGNVVSVNDTLAKGETKTMKLTLSYSAAVTSDLLPKDDVEISNLAIAIIYAQES